MSISARTRFEVLKRDGFACHYCGKRAPTARLQVDHIVAVSKGGSDDPGNLISSCWQCNIGKFTSDLLEDEMDGRIIVIADTEQVALNVLLSLMENWDVSEFSRDEWWGSLEDASKRLAEAPISIFTRDAA